MQGGVIYDHQANDTKPFLGPPNYDYGKYILPFEHDDVFDLVLDEDTLTYNVSYAIYKPDLTLGLSSHPAVPDYPYGKVVLTEDPTIYNRTYKNPFGNSLVDPITPLCDYHGRNRPNITGAIYSCETYDSKREQDHKSIQEYLEAYIGQHTSECVDFNKIPELSNATVQKGNVTAQIVFTQDYVYVSVDFPVVVSKGSYSETVHIQNLDLQLNVRLKKIYELLKRLVEEDVNNIFFDIQNHADTLKNCKDLITGTLTQCLKSGMKVYKYRDVCSTELCTDSCDGCYDDILVIQDNESLVNGQPYLFFAAIENRKPALDLVRQNDTIEGSFIGYDYVVNVSGTLAIDPYGYDPDEDDMVPHGYMNGLYYYGWWNEDYTEELDLIFASHEAFWLAPENYTTRDYSYPALFSTSSDYVDTERNASIQTVDTDIGPHVVKVEVCDNAGECDYQSVNVVVISAPYLYGYNDYEDIPDNYVSLEDPYYLSDLSEDVFTNSISQFEWQLPYDTITTSDPYLTLPETHYDDIEDIDSYVGFIYSSTVPSNNEKIISLYGYDDAGILWPESSTFDVEVKQCFPHRSSDPIYPYGSGTFTSNHTCCDDDYQVEPSTTVCYSEVEYGCLDNFTGSDPSDINVYKYAIEAHCDGTRGNICDDSSPTESYTLVDTCGAGEHCVYGSSTCEQGADGTSCTPTDYCYGSLDCSSANYVYDELGNCLPEDTSLCSCDESCDPIDCDDSSDYNWTDTTCSYNCADCGYDGISDTYCTETEQDGCWNNEYCYFGITCDETGSSYGSYERCMSPGESSGTICYTDAPEADRCDTYNEECKTEDEFSDTCTVGDPTTDGYCLNTLDQCLANIECTSSGWTYDTHTLPDDLLDCEYGGIDEGYCLKSEECHYNAECTSSDFSYNSVDCPEPTYFDMEIGDLCYYEVYGNDEDNREDDCDINGCNIDSCTISNDGDTCHAQRTEDEVSGCV